VTRARQSLGRWGEDIAARYLSERGYLLLERNVRTRYGEIDLVMQDPGAPLPSGQEDGVSPGNLPTLVFVEVKTRSTRTFGHPEESVNPRKQAHLQNAAQYYIQQHPDLQCNWRIDVIAIQRAAGSQPAEIVHFENALGM
jgi:putative endonuclease